MKGKGIKNVKRCAGISPKARHARKREAEEAEVKRKNILTEYKDIKKLFNNRR